MKQSRWQEKKFSVIKGDKWMTCFGKKNFGWQYDGTETRHDGYDVNTTYDSYGSHSTVTERLTTSLVFSRLNPYTGNILFRLTEFLYNIVTFLRRTILTLLPFAIFAAVAWLITVVACDNAGSFNVLWDILFTYVIPIVFGVYAASVLLPLIGKMWRNLFKIDRKNDEK